MARRPPAVLLVLLALVTGRPAPATDCAEYGGGLTCVGSAEVPAYPDVLFQFAGYDDLVVKGNTAYAFQSHVGLRIIDLADPAQPVHRGLFPLGNYEHAQLVAIDHHVILELYSQLLVVDVDEADAPELATTVPLPGLPEDVTLLPGRVMLVACGEAGLLVVDVDQPTAPQIIRTLDLGAPVNAVVARGDRALALAGGTLHVLDVAVPSWPAVRGSLAIGGAAVGYALDLEDDVAVVGRGFDTAVVDLADPDAPALLGELEVEGLGATIIDGLAWLGAGWWDQADGLYVYALLPDGRDGRLADLVAWYPLPQRTNRHARLPGTDLVVSVSQGFEGANDPPLGLQVFRRSADALPPATGAVANPHAETRYEAVLRGDWCYIAKGDDLGVFDVSDPTAPVQVQDIPGGLRQIVAMDGALYTTDEQVWGDNRFRSWSLAAPDDPVQLDVLVTENYRIEDLWGRDGFLYATRHDGGLEVIDAREPGALVSVAAQHLAGQTCGQIRTLGDEVWMDATQGLVRLDLSDPLAPAIAEIAPVDGELRQLARDGGRRLACVIRRHEDEPDAWEIWDVTSPPAATRLARQPARHYWAPDVEDVLWHGDVVFVATGQAVELFRWDGAVGPEFLGLIPEGPGASVGLGDLMTLQVHRENLFVFGGWKAELRLWPLPCPAGPTAVDPGGSLPPGGPAPVLTASPNPFNPRTTFQLTGTPGEELAIQLFDARGRRVRTLVGHGALVWDGCDGRGRPVAAGVYLARARTAVGYAACRVALVR